MTATDKSHPLLDGDRTDNIAAFTHGVTDWRKIRALANLIHNNAGKKQFVSECALDIIEHLDPALDRIAAQPAPPASGEVTDAMVDAYLQANDAYWAATDALPTRPDKWRTGTPREATRVSLIAALHQGKLQAEGVTEVERLRAEQSAAVMPLIGPLLDAWVGMDNDTKAAIREQAPDVRRWMNSITRAMETGQAEGAELEPAEGLSHYEANEDRHGNEFAQPVALSTLTDASVNKMREALQIADAFCGSLTAEVCPDSVHIPIRAALAASAPSLQAEQGEPVHWRAVLAAHQVAMQPKTALHVVGFRNRTAAEGWIAERKDFNGWEYTLEPLYASPTRDAQGQEAQPVAVEGWQERYERLARIIEEIPEDVLNEASNRAINKSRLAALSGSAESKGDSRG